MSAETLIETFVELRAKLHRVACRLLSDEMEAEDALHDTFCNLWSSRPPDTSDEARNRLFVVLRNVCINKLRGRRNLPAEFIPDVAVPPATSPVESEQFRELLLQALTPIQRRVFELAVFAEMDYDTIALRLDITPEAVRANMCRARKRIKEQYRRLQL